MELYYIILYYIILCYIILRVPLVSEAVAGGFFTFQGTEKRRRVELVDLPPHRNPPKLGVKRRCVEEPLTSRSLEVQVDLTSTKP